ncbi:DgyrCDS691 [Dimorphilus gyrociliatus]|uniref:DNA-directed RNA polymerase III subunit RPC6 n=1 Tax=Dimorphilus gyrociliatus TaxID=2664684 RepID=A0A7I8V6N4_9ANNE|nr:DgyrCDS691 [Dimorphilus gyrociliatus]
MAEVSKEDSEVVTKIKTEPESAVDLEARILQLCESIPDGINDAIIQNTMPQCDATQRVMAVNRLLSMGKLDLIKIGNKLLYKLKTADAASNQLKGSDHQEKQIYQLIDESKNMGIWMRDIRLKSGLPMSQVQKTLKVLESKKLIKAVNCVNAAKKKVYMLYDVEPDRSLTGGAWYSNQDFESEFVDILNQQCFKFLQQKLAQSREGDLEPTAKRNASYASSTEIWKFICELGISKVKLEVEDIETIMNTLIYDGKVEFTVVPNGDGSQLKIYRAVVSVVPTSGFVRTPCGVCPVFNDCYEDWDISPSNCQYMNDWLSF